jgi:hypothetical protein
MPKRVFLVRHMEESRKKNARGNLSLFALSFFFPPPRAVCVFFPLVSRPTDLLPVRPTGRTYKLESGRLFVKRRSRRGARESVTQIDVGQTFMGEKKNLRIMQLFRPPDPSVHPRSQTGLGSIRDRDPTRPECRAPRKRLHALH